MNFAQSTLTRAVSILALAAVGLATQSVELYAQHEASVATVKVVSDDQGHRLQVDGRDFLVQGMNWDYFPIGTNYSFSLWNQTDAFIEAALSREMPLLRDMGVNAIRLYNGIPPRWVKFIYERYGIHTVLNHPMARYGYTIDGTWIPAVDYSDPRLRSAVKAEILAIVEEFKDTPGILMWLLGNENNYGLTWSSFEIEALPEGERHAARAKHLYSLYGEISSAIQAMDSKRPVAIANGDLQYIDLVAQECGNIDVFGTNVYRGISARDLYAVVKEKLGIPVMYTEFGADAFNAKEGREDQLTQAKYLIGQWQEIYEMTAGKGRVGNCIGGLTFQWTDGWWKFGQTERLDIHDTNASWPNGGYWEDFVEGANNMNEEWWGICAKGPTENSGLYDIYPRAAYYCLRQAYELDPYAKSTDLDAIRRHFGSIEAAGGALLARGDKASLLADAYDRVHLSGVRMEFETFSTGGDRTDIPNSANPRDSAPSFTGFDQMQSFYAEFEAKPADNLLAKVSFNVLGNVARNPIDQIFYENRGLARRVQFDGGTEAEDLSGIERVKVYQGSVSWDEPWFRLDGFYRTGHLHWQFEGDFFGLYRNAYYGENIDIYNGEAPVGMEFTGKRSLSGLKVAFGPQLWWGANPAILGKYQFKLGPLATTAVYQEDVASQGTVNSTIAIPEQRTRKGTLQFEAKRGKFNLTAGGIWAGNTKIGDKFNIIGEQDGQQVSFEDEVKDSDTLGVKGKLTWESGKWHWYGQGAYMGLVADGGPTETITFTGWRLKDSGSGNQGNFLSGIAANFGSWQFGPNFLWQRPLAGPVPFFAGDADNRPTTPRNIIDDPFAVRGNREMTAGEFLITYDPTPATWAWAWDNVVQEDASFSAAAGVVFRHMPTTVDAAIGILENGATFAFEGGTPARDLWEVHGRIVGSPSKSVRFAANLFAGEGEPIGNDPRLVKRYGGDFRITWNQLALDSFLKINDWGPYDFNRDFNLTYPMQAMADISYSLGTPRWFGFPQTKFGVRGLIRSLDVNSPRYCPQQILGPDGELTCDPTAPGDDGREWEIRTYLHVSM